MDTLTPEHVWRVLRGIVDPELLFSIVDLGLVYAVGVDEGRRSVGVTMTFTSPACPLQDYFRKEIVTRLTHDLHAAHVQVRFTFSPVWSPQKASIALQEHFALLGIPLTRF
jgi:metal-sulfur cluster biosynthetic enzyme